jgi:hypothetical protein
MDIQIVDRDGSWYLEDGSGNPVPGADEPHVSREEAQAHLDALVEAEKVEKSDDLTGQPKTMFIPLVKVDVEKREVWGYASVEEVDHTDEIMDFGSSLPYFQEWSAATKKRSGGKSLGNLRSMHQDIAAGKLIGFQPDAKAKAFWIGAKVIDDAEWKKVQEGVYTGFSVGGSYVRRWYDQGFQKMRYTAKPLEISLVDAPCVPSATFQIVKADGVTESHGFAPTNGKNILKADIPAAEEPAGTVDVPDETIERLPDPTTTVTLDPDNPPSGDQLAAAHGETEKLDPTATAPIGQTQAIEKTEEAKEVKKDEAVSTFSGPPEGQVCLYATIYATPDVAERFVRFMAALTHASNVGHSAGFVMGLDGDGSERFSIQYVSTSSSIDRPDQIPTVETEDIGMGMEVVKGDRPRVRKIRVSPRENRRMVKVRQPEKRMIKVR